MHVEKDRNSDTQWFALWTRSRQEKTSAARLHAMGFAHFLPLRTELRQWTDRKHAVEVPLFPGYLFVQLPSSMNGKLQILQIPGIAGFVGNLQGPAAIPQEQIEAIRLVIAERIEGSVLSSLQRGTRVRVTRGLLAGIKGIMLPSNSTTRILISIDLIQQSIAIAVSREDVQAIEQDAA